MRHGLSLFGRRRVRFNPRICKRCDAPLQAWSQSRRVSIHASVKDATAGYYLISYKLNVSIHASVKDATKKPIDWLYKSSGFNPRICKRCDGVCKIARLFVTGFNPRICKRCDLYLPNVLRRQ